MVPAGVAKADDMVVLCGPTAAGKTEVAVALAQALGAEIVAADSRTVYRGMDIGTAKPTPQQRRLVPHHLLDVADPSQAFTVADFQRLARAAIGTIRSRGRLPLPVGGTGLYLRAVTDDLAIPQVLPDHSLRASLEADEMRLGPGHLHARLAALDPGAAARIHPSNVRRLVRALEVTLVTGRPVSEQQGRGVPPGALAMVGLTMARPRLYERIDARVDAQIAAGLVEETRRLLAQGIPPQAPSMQTIGYREIAAWLRGEYEFPEAVRRIKQNTRRYAKRQLTWFRRDPRIVWVDATDAAAAALVARVRAIIDAELERQGRG
jgi:tRNA dimethylallyltransferase